VALCDGGNGRRLEPGIDWAAISRNLGITANFVHQSNVYFYIVGNGMAGQPAEAR
jgi:hypothetical protein